MKNWKGTKGKWKAEFSKGKKRTSLEVNVYKYPERPDFKETIYKYTLDEDQCSSEKCSCTIIEKADAELIADAGNTIQECGLLPSELLAENQMLKSALLDLVFAKDFIDNTGSKLKGDEEFWIVAKELINKKSPNGDH